MLTLHGFSFSNYYNIVKHALLHKGVPFEEHKVYTDEDSLKSFSPVGKVPALTTEDGVNLSESTVLIDYLEDAYPDVPLYPSAASERARVRQLVKISELYIELPARRMINFVFGGGEAPAELKEEVRTVMERGVHGLNTLASFSPYMAGDSLTAADIYLRYALAIPKIIGPAQLDWDVAASINGLAEWEALMADSDASRKVDADAKENTPEFMARFVGG